MPDQFRERDTDMESMDQNEIESADKKLALLNNQADFLMKSFDCVIIFAQRYDPKTTDTISFNTGRGSWAARRGQIHDWVLVQDEVVREKARREVK